MGAGSRVLRAAHFSTSGEAVFLETQDELGYLWDLTPENRPAPEVRRSTGPAAWRVSAGRLEPTSPVEVTPSTISADEYHAQISDEANFEDDTIRGEIFKPWVDDTFQPGGTGEKVTKLLDEGAVEQASRLVAKGAQPRPVEPDLAFATSIVRYRAGDDRGAFEAAVAASASPWARRRAPEVALAVAHFAALSQAPPDRALAALNSLRPAEYASQLAEAYRSTGDFDRARMVLDQVADPEQRLELLAAILSDESKTAEPGSISASIERTWAAVASMSPSTSTDPKGRDAIKGAIRSVAVSYHNIFTKTRDLRYAEAARQIYRVYARIPDAKYAPMLGGYANELAVKIAEQMAHPELANVNRGNMGRMDKEFIRSQLHARQWGVTTCFERSLRLDPGLAGRVVLRFAVSSAGRVTWASTEPRPGATGLAALGSCLVRDAEQWSFPVPRSSSNEVTMVSYPYVFRAY